MVDEMVELLCLPNRHFNVGVKTKRLHKVGMTSLAQFQTAFMLDNIVPNSHELDMPMKRDQFLYPILKDLYIDIGQILSHEMFTMAKKRGSSLGLPCLITAICTRRGIYITSGNQHFLLRWKWVGGSKVSS